MYTWICTGQCCRAAWQQLCATLVSADERCLYDLEAWNSTGGGVESKVGLYTPIRRVVINALIGICAMLWPWRIWVCTLVLYYDVFYIYIYTLICVHTHYGEICLVSSSCWMMWYFKHKYSGYTCCTCIHMFRSFWIVILYNIYWNSYMYIQHKLDSMRIVFTTYIQNITYTVPATRKMNVRLFS